MEKFRAILCIENEKESANKGANNVAKWDDTLDKHSKIVNFYRKGLGQRFLILLLSIVMVGICCLVYYGVGAAFLSGELGGILLAILLTAVCIALLGGWLYTFFVLGIKSIGIKKGKNGWKAHRLFDLIFGLLAFAFFLVSTIGALVIPLMVGMGGIY